MNYITFSNAVCNKVMMNTNSVANHISYYCQTWQFIQFFAIYTNFITLHSTILLREFERKAVINIVFQAIFIKYTEFKSIPFLSFALLFYGNNI